MIDQIHWFGHGSFMIRGSHTTIFINPWRIASQPFCPDIILIGHHHYEHFSPVDIEKLRDQHTRVISNEQVSSQIKGAEMLRPYQILTLGRMNIRAVPAYSPDDPRHPEKDMGLGFVISMDYYDIYYAGDTTLTSDVKRIKPDIAILPIDGNGTMNVDEAAEAVRIMRPRWVIPSNWGTIGVGVDLIDAQRFASLVDDYAIPVIPVQQT